MDPGEDGWSEWIHPLPGYLMQCCDCNLVHELQVAISARNGEESHPTNEGEDGQHLVVFRMRRDQPARRAALREMVRLDEEMGLYDDEAAIAQDGAA